MTAKSNATWHANNGLGIPLMYPYHNTCMAKVKNCFGDMHIVIPFENLHNDISKEDVYKWVKIGNELIFNAEIKEDFIKFNGTYYNSEYITLFNKYIQGKKVVLKNKDSYVRNDATEIQSGRVVSNNSGRITIEILKSNAHSGHWIIDANDFELEDTKECLATYIALIYSKYIKVDKEVKNNSFVITINLNKCVSNYHKLATLTFYRYLYGSSYPKIVRDTLDVINQGINPWDALMLVHAAKRSIYGPYYGLTHREIRAIPTMEKVLKNLSKSMRVNDSFLGNETYNYLDSFRINLDKINIHEIHNILLKNNRKIKVECIDNKCITLTCGKTYDTLLTTTTKYKIMGNDYVARYYSINHFKEVK